MLSTVRTLFTVLDDGAARRVLTREFGKGRVIGSIGSLREAVSDGLISGDDAWNAYQLMVAKAVTSPSWSGPSSLNGRVAPVANRNAPSEGQTNPRPKDATFAVQCCKGRRVMSG